MERARDDTPLIRTGTHGADGRVEHPVPEGEPRRLDRDPAKRHAEAGLVQEANEQLAAANEELAATNEELAATNEELRATTEELQEEIAERGRTEQSLRESREHYRSLFDNMLNGFAFCRMLFAGNRPVDFTYLEVNRAFESLTGLKNVTGKNVSEVIPGLRETNPELFEIYGRVSLTGRPEQLETYVEPLGMWFLISVYSPQKEHFVAVFEVITERKRAEKALRELNATLENTVARRTAELARRATQLQKLTLELSQAEERERRRIAVLLHEDLQQQIAGAKFHLNLVRSRSPDDALRRHVDKVDKMLTGAMEKSRTLSRDLSPAVLHMNDLAEVLSWLVDRIREQRGLQVQVRFSGDMTLHSEALALFLFRAAQEMLLNVVKHARVQAADIRVRRIGRYVGLSVSDQGRGFDPQELQETSGVGLFSIRERTELLGGSLRVKSAPGRGSRLRITVPDARESEDGGPKTEDAREPAEGGPEPSAAVRPPSRGSRLRVLLVDDHDIVREGLAALLQEAPDIVVVGEAADGREAINRTSELRPDVVVMDVSMPLMSGDQATRQIKMFLPKTRVIALSMYDEADKKERMYQAGAEGYVLKTASAEELLAAIRGK